MAHRHEVQKRARGGRAGGSAAGSAAGSAGGSAAGSAGGSYKKGGRVVYSGAGSNVEHEAESTGTDHKRGGRAHRKEGGRVFGRGGKVRLDRRARGGGVGSDRSPFSSASRGKDDVGRTSHTVPTPGPK